MINTEVVIRKQTVSKEKAEKPKILSFVDTKELHDFCEREKAKFVFSPVPHHK